MVEIDRLKVKYPQGFSLKQVNMNIKKGQIISLVGESGSGKTTFGKAVVGMLEKDITIDGKILIDGVDIYSLSESKFKMMQMKDFSICFQNSRELLNPLLTIGSQLFEILQKVYHKKDIKKEAIRLLSEVGLKEEILEKYPYELSGGMVQKILIISAICLKPKFVVLDEPTSSLDKESKSQVIKLIQKINKENKTSFLIITHDLVLAKTLSHKIAIIYEGNIVELGEARELIESPSHPYTRGLINSCIELNPYKDIWGILDGDNSQSEIGCPFFSRCNQRLELCGKVRPTLEMLHKDSNRLIACNRDGIIKFIQGKEITKRYKGKDIIKNIDIKLMAGEIVSLIGQPGIGKTTLLKILGGYLDPDHGKTMFENKKANYKKLHKRKYGLQMVFQDPSTSINPNMNVVQAVAEPLRLSSESMEYKDEVINVLCDVGLPTSKYFLNTKIKFLSGGQKQRVSIARSLIMKPRVLLADEPTSMLDVSSKANLLRLLKGIQNSKGFSMIIVTHDVALAAKISDRVYLLEGPSKIREYKGSNIAKLM